MTRCDTTRGVVASCLALLEQVAGSHLLEFTEIPEALEWRASKGP